MNWLGGREAAVTVRRTGRRHKGEFAEMFPPPQAAGSDALEPARGGRLGSGGADLLCGHDAESDKDDQDEQLLHGVTLVGHAAARKCLSPG